MKFTVTPEVASQRAISSASSSELPSKAKRFAPSSWDDPGMPGTAGKAPVPERPRDGLGWPNPPPDEEAAGARTFADSSAFRRARKLKPGTRSNPSEM